MIVFGSASAEQRKGDPVGDLRDHAELPGPTQSRKGADMIPIAPSRGKTQQCRRGVPKYCKQWAGRAPNDLEEGGNVLEDAQVL